MKVRKLVRLVLSTACLALTIFAVTNHSTAQKPRSTDVPVTAALADYLDVTDSTGAMILVGSLTKCKTPSPPPVTLA